MLRADAGCNTIGGHYSLDGDQLSVARRSSTAMACDGAAARGTRTPGSRRCCRPGRRLALDGDQLTLTSGDTVIVFVDRETADPDRPLVGTNWKLETILDGAGRRRASRPG